MRRILAIGHRGAAGLEPENTIRGFLKAVEIGVDIVELDVRLTKDNKMVVIHNETTDKTTNIKALVKDLTLVELQKADAGKGERVPLLEEVFEAMKGNNTGIQVELKARAASAAATLIRKFKYEKKVRVTSFLHDELLRFKELAPEVTTGALICHRPADPRLEAAMCKADRLHIAHDMADEQLLKEIHSAGLEAIVWGGIVTAEKMDRLIALDIDGLGSDLPDLLIERLKKAGKR